MGDRRELLFAAVGSGLCLIFSVATSQFFPFPMLLIAAYFGAIAAHIRSGLVWAVPVVPILLGFIVSPHDAFWLVAFGLVALPGWIGVAIGRLVGRKRRSRPAVL